MLAKCKRTRDKDSGTIIASFPVNPLLISPGYPPFFEQIIIEFPGISKPTISPPDYSFSSRSRKANSRTMPNSPPPLK